MQHRTTLLSVRLPKIFMFIYDVPTRINKTPPTQRAWFHCNYPSSKHEGYTSNNGLLHWLSMFLTNRHQRVLLEGAESQESPVTSGVPQGTVLGPLLFLIYINDLPMMVKSKVRLFADDCIVYREIGNKQDAKALQEDFNLLCWWESQWRMSLNPSKCYTMHVSHKVKPIITPYTMKEKRLEQVTHHPYLGLEISKDLTWSHHINKITTKANQMLGIVRRNLHSCSKSVKATAYKTLACPRLEYCVAIWDPHQATSQRSIETIQRRAARFVVNNYDRRYSVTSILSNLQWETLENRRTKLCLIALFKEIHKITPSNVQFRQRLSSTRRQTGPKILETPSFNKTCYQHSFYPRTTREWNLLPPDLRSILNINAFKSKLDQIM